MSPRRVALVVLAALAVAACQPVDDAIAPAEPAIDPDAVAASPAPGTPQTSTAMPADLAALLEGQSTTATEWQADPRPAEVLALLEDGRWTGATVTYLAPDADRFLVVAVGSGGGGQQRPTLDTLGLEPIAAGGVEAIPPLPDGILPPAPLVEAAAAARGECGLGDVTTVLYSTGAPAAWDGERWTAPLRWRATLLDADDAGVTVDPVSGDDPSPCLEPA
jgi:hypothetical protein